MDNVTLATLLKEIGVDVKRSDGKEITGRCPVHVRTTGHEDHSPSWSMNASSGLWICFSCGARGSLEMLVSELTGSEDALASVREFTFKSAIDNAFGNTVTRPDSPDVDWLTYSQFSRVPEKAAQSRSLNEKLLWDYGVRWDSKHKNWIIPITSAVGELMGYQAKKTGWVRNYPENVKKSEALFGLDMFKSKTAVLVESPLDVVRFADVFESPQAMASYGSAVSDWQLGVLAMVADRLIIAMDNDSAGIHSARTIFKYGPRFRKGILFFNYGISEAKDIGDMSDREILRGISHASLVPPKGLK